MTVFLLFRQTETQKDEKENRTEIGSSKISDLFLLSVLILKKNKKHRSRNRLHKNRSKNRNGNNE